jgi:hypothetical protein
MTANSKIITYVSIAIVAILLFTNPSINDFQSEVKTAYNEADGQSQWIVKLLGTVGKLQVSRKSYLVFSVFKSQGKSVLGDTEAEYMIGFLGTFSKIEKGELEWLCKGKYSESKSIKAKDL